MQSTFNKISAKRRSIYALGDQVTASPEEIFDLVKDNGSQLAKCF